MFGPHNKKDVRGVSSMHPDDQTLYDWATNSIIGCNRFVFKSHTMILAVESYIYDHDINIVRVRPVTLLHSS